MKKERTTFEDLTRKKKKTRPTKDNNNFYQSETCAPQIKYILTL